MFATIRFVDDLLCSFPINTKIPTNGIKTPVREISIHIIPILNSKCIFATHSFCNINSFILPFFVFSVSLPRVRDFQGVPTKSFDGRGNYTLGVKEQLIFPEISFDDVDKTRGMDIVIVTTANTDEESRELLAGLGMPFAK